MGNVRWQRGKIFEDEIRRSCTLIEDSWRLRLTDGRCAGPRPADMLLITPDGNYLMELKRRACKNFHLKYLEKHQIEGLLKFSEMRGPNYGLVLWSVLTADMCRTFAIDIKEIIDYCEKKGVLSIPFEDVVESINAVELKEITVEGERAWDLQPMLEVFG